MVQRGCPAIHLLSINDVLLNQGTRSTSKNVQEKAVPGKSTVTDLLKALRNGGHAVPQQDDATVLWKNFLRVGACTCDVMLYGACAGDVRQ
jgi:hypothetical protein